MDQDPPNRNLKKRIESMSSRMLASNCRPDSNLKKKIERNPYENNTRLIFSKRISKRELKGLLWCSALVPLFSLGISKRELKGDLKLCSKNSWNSISRISKRELKVGFDCPFSPDKSARVNLKKRIERKHLKPSNSLDPSLLESQKENWKTPYTVDATARRVNCLNLKKRIESYYW